MYFVYRLANIDHVRTTKMLTIRLKKIVSKFLLGHVALADGARVGGMVGWRLRKVAKGKGLEAP